MKQIAEVSRVGITVSVAARELAVSTWALIAWADKGRIRSSRSAGNWRLFNPADVQRLKKELMRRRSDADPRAIKGAGQRNG